MQKQATVKAPRNSLGKTASAIWSGYSFIFIFVVIFLVYLFVSSSLTFAGIMNILRHSAVVGVIALGMGVVIITGEIDLSVGSMLAMVSSFSVVVFNATNNIFLTLLFAILFGAFCGLLNGLMVGALKMPAFIVTLATMLIYRSIAQYACQHLDAVYTGGGNSLYKMSRELSNYDPLFSFGNSKLFGIPTVGVILIVLTAIFVYMGTSTKFGKKLYALGSNAKAAQLAGINTSLMKVLVFVISGAMVGVGSFLWVSMYGSADPATGGSSYEMYAIAAVVLGGISMAGGRGKLIGIIFGTLSYTVIDKIIVALKMDSLINNTIKGVILIIAIMIQIIAPMIKSKLTRRHRST